MIRRLALLALVFGGCGGARTGDAVVSAARPDGLFLEGRPIARADLHVR